MKTILVTALIQLVTISTAFASNGNDAEALGFMSALFFVIGVMIVLYQLVPGLMTLGRILKEMFSEINKIALDSGSN
jgi:hypothetical protein